MTPVFYGQVKNGKLLLNKRDILDEYLKSLDGDVELIVRKKQKQRSNPQNAYFHGVVIKILSDELGYFPNETKDALKAMFLTTGDKPLKRVRSTSDLTTVEMEDFLSKIRMFAASELNIIIPLPNEII